MSDPAEVLMLSGVARPCPDCLEVRIFVPVEDCDGHGCEVCCTSCGAALLVDPALDDTMIVARVA